VHKKVF